MPKSYSPLRYPGGKAKLYSFIKRLIEVNELKGETYIEPFAGGSGLALKLLFKNNVRRIIINDYDPAIYSIWFSILNHCEELCELIQNVPLSVEEWNNQKSIYLQGKKNNIVNFGFSALYLNRTNISGIITGGIIGGIEQNGKYKIDARFNKKTLINRIQNIYAKRDQIILKNMDAIELLSPQSLNSYRKVFIYCDPPYVKQGSKLYKNSFTESDHKALFMAMKKCKRKWLVTYDVCEFIANTYKNYRRSIIDINYSANNSRKANEYAFYNNNMLIPKEVEIDITRN
jgi:DNA adenine methylase